MGTELARRLLNEQDGIELTVWNRTAERAQPLVEEGAELAASPTEAVANAEVIITSLRARRCPRGRRRAAAHPRRRDVD